MTAVGDPRRSSGNRRRETCSDRRRHPDPPAETEKAFVPEDTEACVEQEGLPGEDRAGAGTPSEELEALKDQNLRLQAEFDNYRKRQAREFHRLCSQGKRDLIADLLAILDDIDFARDHLRAGTPAEETVTGMLQIASKLEAILGREGLESMKLESMDPFDPKLHEAVFAEEVEGIDQDVVLEVLRKGYTLDQELLRVAMVKVGRPGKAAAEGTE